MQNNYIIQSKDNNTLNLLSKSRIFLYGLAIIWIVLFHAKFSGFPLFIQFPIFKIGYGGVDIFILLSGFGIFYSLNKNNDEMEFYRKRILRLLPTIPIMLIFIYLARVHSIHEIVGYITNINLFVSESFILNPHYGYFWYVPCIMLFYILSPIIYNTIIKKPKNIVFLLLFSLIVIIPFLNHRILIMIARFPLFIFGMYLGYLSKNNVKISQQLFIVTNALAIISFISLIFIYLFTGNIKFHYGLIRYPFYFIAPVLCFDIAIIYNILVNNNALKKIFEVIEFAGKYSLEIYLVDALLSCGYIPFTITCTPIGKVLLSISLGIIYGFIYKFVSKGFNYVRK